MKEEIQKHEELKQCAIYAYGKNKEFPKNYILVGKALSERSGLDAVVFKHDNEIIIAFRGTESFKDIKNDINMALKKMPSQANNALILVDDVKKQYPNAELILTGHSLGGSLAQIVAAINGLTAVTFNAYGTKNLFKTNMKIYTGKIINYINFEDSKVITSNTRNQVGTCYSVRSKIGSINKHKAENMESLSTRERINQKDYGKGEHFREERTPVEISSTNNKCSG